MFSSSVSTQPERRLQFPQINNIIFVQSKQSFTVFLTANGQAFIYNSFPPDDQIEQVYDDSIHILKISLLDNNRLFIIYKKSTENRLKFEFRDYPYKINATRTQVLEDIKLMSDEIEHFDIDYNNLVYKQFRHYRVIDVVNDVIKFDKTDLNYKYSHDCVACVHSNSNWHQITVKILSSNTEHVVTINDNRPLSLIDLFPEQLVYTQAGILYAVNFDIGDPVRLSETPLKYFIGRHYSTALYPTYFMTTNKPWNKFEFSANLICADLAGILIVYEKINSRLAIIRDNGELLQSINLTIKPVYITINTDTLQLCVASKSCLQIF